MLCRVYHCLRPTTRTSVFFRHSSTANHPTATQSNNILEELRVLCTRGHLQEALCLFYSTLNVPHCQQTYATLLHACARLNCFQQGQALHHHMVAHNPQNSPDIYVTNHLINMYAKCGYLDYAHHLFDQMPHKNIVSWTVLISGYAQQDRADDCFRIFSNMLSHHRPTEFAYASVISSSNCYPGRQVHALALKTSFNVYVYVANALITMYSNCGRYGVYDVDKDEAWTVFKTMEFRSLITWNSMIAGFQIRGLGAQAITLFSLMHRNDIEFDRATFLSVFSSLCESNSNDGALGLKCCFQLHCLAIKTGFILEIGVATALVKAYSNIGRGIADCYNLFLETSGRRDVVSWTGIITTLVEQDPEAAIFLFSQLRNEGFTPDPYTFSVVLKACAGLVTDRLALAVHSQVIKAGFEDDTVITNALIHAYSRCGSIALSKQVFNEMVFRDTVSWNSMLKAYALHGQAKESLQFFAEMNVQPDATTFVALLSSCSHAGLVEEGTKIFDTMLTKYGIVPQLDHFACMVDILGRAGKIPEAAEVVRKMPMEPDSVVWSALLGACRKHGETQLANIAATKLKELDPENSLGYVLESNIYCSAGSFSEACLTRNEMERLKVKKKPGLSWI